MMQEQRFNAVSRFAILLSLCGLGIIISSIATGLIGNTVLHVDIQHLADELMKPANTELSRILQILTSFFIMAMPALAMGKIAGFEPMTQLGFRTKGSIVQLGMVTIIVAASLLLGGALAELNSMIPIPQNAETYFKGLEDAYNKQVMSIANMHNAADYFYSLIVLVLVPSIFEEMLFRGTLQPILIDMVKKPFWGIFLTGVLFSLMHISYYGFLFRLCLGMTLGYLYYYSKNMWMPIAAHFLNNAYTLTVIYALSSSGKLTPEAISDTYPLYYGIIGAVIMYALFKLYKKECDRVLATAIPENNINASI
jgi:uncharacterized protein